MPIKVPDFLPAKETLIRENIFVMDETRAFHQDIRPLVIAILNLMPNKEVTETQLLRLLGNTPLQVEVILLHPATHRAKHTDEAYLQSFYRTFEEIKEHNVDGLIITGAPIGHLPYDEITYWEELKQIMEWSNKHVTSTLFLCWGALAGLYHHYDIHKVYDDKKTFGIFPHKRSLRNKQLMRGFDDVFWVPHSRYNYIRRSDVEAHPELEILAESDETGVYLIHSRDGKHVFVTGHAEYEENTLREEYERDRKRGLNTAVPENYFPDNDPTRDPIVSWRAHASLLFSNWLNYYVYQATPFDIERVSAPVSEWRGQGLHMDSKLAQIGTHSDPATGGVSFPIYNATAFRHPGLGQSTGFDYSRSKNPTRSVLELAIAELESGDQGFACSTGMAALQTVFALFRTGDHLICSLDLYGGTYRMIEQILSRAGVTASYVDTNDLQAMEGVLKPETKAVFIESPTNPMMMITDIRKAAEWAKSKGLLTIVDNTLMTPFFQRPIELGADIVVHSATKYLGGHNDVLAGLIVTKGEKLNTEMAFLHNAIGAVLGANDSWLLMRGMKTLALRMERHQYNATMLAQYLTKHPLVENVFYPGLKIHPGYGIQQEQTSGNTGIFSFRVKDSRYVAHVLKHIKLINFAESLGGVESLMTYPMVQTHSNIPEAIRNAIGVDNCLLRLSTGVEHIDDLIADLSQALQKAADEVALGGDI